MTGRPAPQRKLAFGVEPADYAYRLRLARYVGLAESIHRHLASRPGGGTLRLVEIGSGKGRTLRYVESLGDVARLRFFGLDVSASRLENIYRQDLWSLVEGDAHVSLPFRSASFDIVVCEQVLEHLRDPWRVFSELDRILAPGGVMVVGVPVFLPLVPWIRQNLVLPVYRAFKWPVAHIQSFSCRSFLAGMRGSPDLEILDVRGFRLLSGGALRFLEDCRWWYDLNRFLGRTFPALCQEIQVVARKRPGPAS